MWKSTYIINNFYQLALQQAILFMLFPGYLQLFVIYRDVMSTKLQCVLLSLEFQVCNLMKFSDTEEINAYLTTIEGMMRVYEIDEVRWAFWLVLQLTGKAQQTYTTLISDNAANYAAVKLAILRQSVTFLTKRDLTIISSKKNLPCKFVGASTTDSSELAYNCCTVLWGYVYKEKMASSHH